MESASPSGAAAHAPRWHPDRILCAVDFTERSAAALAVSRRLARQFGANVWVLHVANDDAPERPVSARRAAGTKPVGRTLHRLRLFVEDAIRDDTIAPRVSVECGNPVSEILRHEQAVAADLIVMGAPGAAESIAEAVAEAAAAPVLFVPDTASARSDKAFHRLLCGIAEPDAASPALTIAAAVAQSTQGELLALHVSAPAPERSFGRAARREALQELQRLEAAIPSESRRGCDVQCLLAEGAAADELAWTARVKGADLTVIGAGGRGRLVRQLARLSTTPLLLVRQRVTAVAGHSSMEERAATPLGAA